jgi:hypothetical protein
MIITINKLGELGEYNSKNVSILNLFKICNYRNNNNFELLCSWNDEYELYGKKVGRSGNENMYEFPPPIDKELYFGTLCIIKKTDTHENQNQTQFSIKEWKHFYNKQMGGFEDLELNEENSVDSVYSDEEYTEEGYIKDNFVVDNKELTSEEYLVE